MYADSRVLILATVAATLVPATAGATTYSYTVFDDPGAPLTLAFGINNANQVVGGTGTVGFLKTGNNYTSILVPGAKTSQAYGICDIGYVAGFFSDANGYHGFLKTYNQYTALNYPQAKTTFAFGVNLRVQVVGTYSTTAGVSYGYLYSGGNFTNLAVPGAVASSGGTQAHGINALGQIVGFYGQGVDPTTGRTKVGGFLYDQGTYKTFGVPGAYATEPDGINNHGDIVGTYGTLAGGYGFVYSNGAYSTLQVPGASKTEAQAINDKGEVAGWVVIGSAIHGFLATPQN